MTILVAGEIVPAPGSIKWTSQNTPDFDSATYIPDPFFEKALEDALFLAQNNSSEVKVLLLDYSHDDSLARMILASGVNQITRISGSLLFDPLLRARILTDQAGTYDVIFTGYDSLISPSSPLGPYISHLCALPYYSHLTVCHEENTIVYKDWFSSDPFELTDDRPAVISIHSDRTLRYPTLQAALAAQDAPLTNIIHHETQHIPLYEQQRMRLLPGNAAEAVIEILNERGMFEL